MPAPEDGSLAEKTSTSGGLGGVEAVVGIDIRTLGGGEGNWVRWPRFYPNLEVAEAIIGVLKRCCRRCLAGILP
jgi:hypothetical protein